MNITCSVVSAGHRCSSISFCTFLAPASPLAVSSPSPLSAASTVEVSSPTVSVPSISAWCLCHHGSPSPSRLPPASPLSVCYSSSPAAPSPLTKHLHKVAFYISSSYASQEEKVVQAKRQVESYLCWGACSRWWWTQTWIFHRYFFFCTGTNEMHARTHARTHPPPPPTHTHTWPRATQNTVQKLDL